MLHKATHTKESLEKTKKYLSQFSHVSIFKEDPETRDDLCNQMLIEDLTTKAEENVKEEEQKQKEESQQ